MPHPQDNTPGKQQLSALQAPPSITAHPLLKALPESTFLPAELLGILNHTYFLHLLVTDPSKVVPPGKSILSVLGKPHAQVSEPGRLHEIQSEVEDTIRRAFWDAAYESLSAPDSSTQLARLKLIYHDMYEALEPLLPENHKLLLLLSSPLSPTSAPLISAISDIRDILHALRQRCAPIRDTYIDSLLQRVSDVPQHEETAKLGRLIIDTVRDVLKLSEAMRDDLSEFVLGTLSEEQLRVALRDEARRRERAVTLDLWREPGAVKALVAAWINELTQPYTEVAVSRERVWIVRLVHALSAPTPAICPLPTKPVPGTDGEPPPELPNRLPPPFFFSTPALEYLQNLLQALVIAGALRALVPSATSGTDFMPRIWTLLESAVDSEAPGPDDTKLANLADEVLRARGAAVDAEESARLRAAVERTLQVRDPAFALLQRRLLVALATRLAQPPNSEHADIPREMRAGRHRPGRSAGVGTARLWAEEAIREWDGFSVKGFEDAELVKRVREVGVRLKAELGWLSSVWPNELR
ncbi:hypothetical protein PENSPDRAFT_676048 [Peniophora sp. CONT]|nr:hypothetical protein PENSPDRAFT_676048 [Peniophora sp. CONT]